jgi:predicted acyltransferase
MKPERLLSLDAFRGATIASMILVNNPGSGKDVYAPLEHAAWNGWTFTDLVFPFFLWIAGVSMTLSFARRGGEPKVLLLHALRRAALIFLIGMLLNGFPKYNFGTIRIPGVLQRIAVCYLLASVIFLYTKWRGQLVATGGLLILYAVLMGGNFDKETNFARYVDSLVLTGHMWSATKVWDPEGIVSTLPAIATVLFGVLAGHILSLAKTASEKTAWMFTGGAALLWAGALLDLVMPINKNLWTCSYSVFMAGMAMVVFGCFYWLIDCNGYQRWSRPFVVYGMNAIAMFVLSGLVARLLSLTGLRGPLYRNVFAPLASPINASLLYAVSYMLFFYVIAWVMYRRKVFVKL